MYGYFEISLVPITVLKHLTVFLYIFNINLMFTLFSNYLFFNIKRPKLLGVPHKFFDKHHSLQLSKLTVIRSPIISIRNSCD